MAKVIKEKPSTSDIAVYDRIGTVFDPARDEKRYRTMNDT